MARKRMVAIVTGTAAATFGILTVPWTAIADQVINDDLIVDGSACVGFDCVNGESFGFDTLRLKENNLRIKFEDTSNSASFPTNDWQLTANDTANGGANKFSIDDITGGRTPFTVEAGARTNALFVESDGDVGLGTNNPVVNLHVVDGNTPTLRLDQDGSSGFAQQTWDVAGNEANFFIRDVTNGSALPFRIFPGAPSNALAIEACGDIGLGLTSPEAPLHIDAGNGVTGTDPTLLLERDGGATAIELKDGDTGEAWRLIADDLGASFKISKTGSGGTEFLVRDNGIVTLRTFNAAPTATPARGDMYIDRSGGLCVAFSAGTWTNVAASGDCT